MQEGGAVEGVGVGCVGAGLVAAAEAEQVGGDDPAIGLSAVGGGVAKEDGDHFAVEVGPGGLAVD